VSVIHAPKEPSITPQMWLFPGLVGAGLVGLFLRLWYLQVVKAPELTEIASKSRDITVPQPAPRGLIFDRNGTMVAGVRPEVVVMAIPAEIKKHPDTLSRLAPLLGVEEKRLQSKMREAAWNPFVPVPIFSGVDPKVGSSLAEGAEEFPGISVETQPVRYYPDVTSFTHVLGYVWTPSARDVERIQGLGREPGPYVGKQGIEKAYEGSLMGTGGGEQFEVDARRRPVRLIGRDTPVPGDQLVLTLDAKLQKIATGALGAYGFPGSVVALDPKNGEVLCMVSSPTYDQTVFEKGISEEEWAALNDKERRPLMNRSIQTALAPGSTFKILTSIAARQAGLWNPNEYIFCGGGFKLGKRMTKCLHHHGSINFETAMKQSCNTYFCSLGYRMGRELLVETAKSAGFGERTELEIGGEVRGNIPDERWLKFARPANEQRFYPGDVVNASIGQGAVSATPLQMANLLAMVANNGVSYEPHLVKSIRSSDGKVSKPVEPKVAHQIDLDPQFWGSLRHSLQAVMETGTGKGLQIPGLVWGGKTGSAEQLGVQKSHSWFVAMAPIEDPKIVICVRVEGAGHGGEFAGPVVKKIVESYLARTYFANASAKRPAADAASAALTPSPSPR
jgi:penicillin-binding protein 2